MGKMRLLNPLNWYAGLPGLLLVLVAGVLPLQLTAEEASPSAHEVARDVKDELLAVIRRKAELEEEGGPEHYHEAVEAVLAPVVDFQYIARGVMGKHGRDASESQREKFAKTFQNGLVSTYAKGMAGYADHEISVLPPEGDVSGKRSLQVVLKVEGGDSTNILAFSMKRNKEGEWKVTNMILNGVNLGKTFRNQFAQAMKKAGDLDTVIENWEV